MLDVFFFFLNPVNHAARGRVEGNKRPKRKLRLNKHNSNE